MSDFRMPPSYSALQLEELREIVGELRGLRGDIRALARALGLYQKETERAATIIKGWSDRFEELSAKTAGSAAPGGTATE